MSVVSPPQGGYPHNIPKTGGLQPSKSSGQRPGAVTSQSHRAYDAPPVEIPWTTEQVGEFLARCYNASPDARNERQQQQAAPPQPKKRPQAPPRPEPQPVSRDVEPVPSNNRYPLFLSAHRQITTASNCTYRRLSGQSVSATRRWAIGLEYGFNHGMDKVRLADIAAYREQEQQPEPQPTLTIELDYELAAEAIAQYRAPQLRVWATFLAYVREHNTGGKIDKATLYELLIASGAKISTRSYRRWLAEGNGDWWNLGKDRLSIRGQKRVTKWLTANAVDMGRADVIETNAPGARNVSVSIAGTIADFEAEGLSIWHYGNADTTENIGRDILTRRFNRSVPTLLDWEKRAGIETVKTIVEDEIDSPHAPEHAYTVRVKVRGLDGKYRWETRTRWRHTNAYNAPAGRHRERKHHIGPRKRREAARRVLEAQTTNQPALSPQSSAAEHTSAIPPCGDASEQSLGAGLHRVGRLVFTPRHSKRRSQRESRIMAWKALERHTERHGDSERPHYVEARWDGAVRVLAASFDALLAPKPLRRAVS